MGELLEQVVDMNSLYESYRSCRQGYSWKDSVQSYDLHWLTNIATTRNVVLNNKYSHKEFHEFRMNERGKTRQVKSVHFGDRILQRSLCDNAIYLKIKDKLIYDNGASQKGRGVSFSRNRLDVHLQKYIRRHGPKGYILTMDMAKFFDNIKHYKLLTEYKKIIDDPDVINLIGTIISMFKIDISFVPENEVKEYINSVFDIVKYTDTIPKSSLTKERFMYKSLGVGSQISQLSGIYYPTQLDNYAKIVLGLKYYGRYMDDLYVIHHSKEELHKIKDKLVEYVNKLDMHVNMKKTQIHPLSKGFTYMQVKYKVTSTGKIKKTLKPDRFTRERRKLKKYKKLVMQGKMPFVDALNSYKSWRGAIKKYSCGRSLRNMDILFIDLFKDIAEDYNG